jgi:transcriptional regulator with XRE-family HTH domain
MPKKKSLQDDPELRREREQIGQRLRLARKAAGYTLETAAKALTDRGFPISKGGVGHWETGMNMPDVHWLQRLARLYKSTIDTMVWDNGLSVQAARIARQYEALLPEARAAWEQHWAGFLAGAAAKPPEDGTMDERAIDESLAPNASRRPTSTTKPRTSAGN